VHALRRTVTEGSIFPITTPIHEDSLGISTYPPFLQYHSSTLAGSAIRCLIISFFLGRLCSAVNENKF
jgi:hypothetical protein